MYCTAHLLHTEVEMVRPSWCKSGRGWGPSVKSSYCFRSIDGKVGEWLFFVTGETSTPSLIQDKLRCRPLLTDRRQHLSIFVQLGPWTAVFITVAHRPSLSFHPPSSVEALAPALVPVAVHHQADDDEEDAAQHGEEHGEENGYPAHPLVTLAHWEERKQREKLEWKKWGNNEGGWREDSEGEKKDLHLSRSMLSTLGMVISSSSSSSSFWLRNTVSW